MAGTCLPREGMHFDYEWLSSPEFAQTLNHIYPKTMRSRKVYGVLELPVVPTISSELYSYKLFIVGKTGVGKTSLMQHLCSGFRTAVGGSSVAMVNDHLFWPCRLRNGELVLIRLEFWDADEYAVTRYQHILPTLRQKADAGVFVFSATDRSSLDDIPGLMSRILEGPSGTDLCRFVIGTKFDDTCHVEVPLRELEAFRRHWGLPVLRISSCASPPANPHDPLLSLARSLTLICETLWHRDRVMAGLTHS